MGKTSSAVHNRWQRKAYDRITFVVKKGEKEKLKKVSDSFGVSTSRFIIDSVNDRVPGTLSPLDDESKKKKPVPEGENESI